MRDVLLRFAAGLLFLAVFLLVSPSVTLATRGCCSWHGGVSYCDTSAGRYVCNDGTYSPSCGCAYVPPVVYRSPTPTPTPLPLYVQTNYTLNKATCQYVLHANWEAPSSYTQYSVSAVRTSASECLDPGPNPDTTASDFSFVNLPAGRYLVNVKPGNAFGWNYYHYCSEVTIPPIKPSVSANAIWDKELHYIDYKATCATAVRIDHGIGYVNAKQGKINVWPTGAVTYTLTATSRDGQTQQALLTLSDATPTPLPTLTPIPTPVLHKEGFLGWFFRLIYGDE